MMANPFFGGPAFAPGRGFGLGQAANKVRSRRRVRADLARDVRIASRRCIAAAPGRASRVW